MSRIKSKFFDQVDRNCPLNDYPRPQFVRSDWLCLNGEYDFAIVKKGSPEPPKYDCKILVPFAPECKLSGVEKHPDENQEMWYRRAFTIPSKWSGKDILLHFEAVDWQTTVYINDKEVGKHIGGYNPFEFNITEYLQDGENVLTVKVYDPTDSGLQTRGKQTHATHGFYYTATSGIWQTVWLEPVEKSHVTYFKFVPDIDKEELYFYFTGLNVDYVNVSVIKDDEVISEKKIELDGTISVPNPILWSPENPYLYDLKIEAYKDDKLVDTIKSYFGMRKYSLEKDSDGYMRLCLNNKPYFQKGLLDQGYWPDGGMTAPTDEALIYDVQKMKDLGFNMLRKHIKRECNRWYYHCDRLGMLVWQDMISGSDYVNVFWCGVLPTINVRKVDDTEKNFARFKRTDIDARNEFKQQLYEMIDGLYSSTSICCWVPFNEAWGQFDAKRIGCAVKCYDASRFVDHASGWHDQGGPDFVSIHRYILPVFLPKKDERRPFVLSEYGGYSRIIDGNVWDKKKSFGYMMFRSEKSLTNAFVRLHEKQIFPLIKKGLSATVYTQISDVEWEVNGIVTYDRKIVKLDEKAVKEVNRKLTY